MNKIFAFLISTTSLAATANAGSFYYDEPSGKEPIAPPTPMVAADQGSSCASDYFDYDFVDLEYHFVDYDDDFFDEAHGVSLGLSRTLTDCTFVTLGGLWQEIDTDHGDSVDFWSFSAGAGMIFPFSERVHLVAEGGAFYGFEGSGDEEAWGGYVGPTLRVGVTRALEGFAGVNYLIDEDTDQFEYSAGAILRITQVVGIKAAWSWNDDEQTVGVGVRIAF